MTIKLKSNKRADAHSAMRARFLSLRFGFSAGFASARTCASCGSITGFCISTSFFGLAFFILAAGSILAAGLTAGLAAVLSDFAAAVLAFLTAGFLTAGLLCSGFSAGIAAVSFTTVFCFFSTGFLCFAAAGFSGCGVCALTAGLAAAFLVGAAVIKVTTLPVVVLVFLLAFLAVAFFFCALLSASDSLAFGTAGKS
ncbi:MAG: hypothetical protein LBR25_02425 [Erysipelotrichaceae bacterium]|nr:hypothetical protein [Erysipelotrichaceae bacterium]